MPYQSNMEKISTVPALVQRQKGITQATYNNKSRCVDRVTYDNLNLRDHVWGAIPLPGAPEKLSTTNQRAYSAKGVNKTSEHISSKAGAAIHKNHFYAKRPIVSYPGFGKIRNDFMGSSEMMREQKFARQAEQKEMQQWQSKQGQQDECQQCF